MDWIRNLKMTIRYKNKEYVLDNVTIEIDELITTHEELALHKQHVDDAMKVACIMIATMVPDLQKSYEDYWSYEINQTLCKNVS